MILKFIKNIFLTVWSIFCFIGIVGNFSHYTFADWIVIIIFVGTPYLIIFSFSKRHKKRIDNIESEKLITSNELNNSIETCSKEENFLSVSSNLANCTEQVQKPVLSKEISENFNKNTPTTYIETKYLITKVDNTPISDEEIPYLIRVGYEHAKKNEQNSSNPKFHRSDYEEELSFNFSMKYDEKITTLENDFETFYENAYKTNDLNERIFLLNSSINAFEKAKKFCYSKGKGGTIYFQDMWEYLHNSSNECFSYLDIIKNDLEETIFKQDAIARILNVIIENDGILQKNIYEHLTDISKSKIQTLIRFLESEEKIQRIKKSNSYELHVLNNNSNI